MKRVILEKPTTDSAAVQDVLPSLYAMQEFDGEANNYVNIGKDVFVEGHSEPILTCTYEADAVHIARMLNATTKLVRELLDAETSRKLHESKALCAVERAAVLDRAAFYLSVMCSNKISCFECPALDSCKKPAGKKHPKCHEIIKEWCIKQAKKELCVGV